MATNIQTRAMLVRLHVSGWSGRALDREATAEVVDRHKTDPKAVRVRKRLVSTDRLNRLLQAGHSVRDRHYDLTLPWDDKGLRVLPVAAYEAYRQKMDAVIETRRAVVDEFVSAYDEAIDEAKHDLGGLFSHDDYPSAEDIRGKMRAEYEFVPIPDGSHFLADLPEEEAERIRTQIMEFTANRLTSAVGDVYRRLGEAVEAMSRQVTPTEKGKTRRVHASVLKSLQALVAAVPEMNLTDDPVLSDLANEVGLAVIGIDPEMLRENDPCFSENVKTKLASDMENLKARFAGYYGGGNADG